jgi:hypothetical protein
MSSKTSAFPHFKFLQTFFYFIDKKIVFKFQRLFRVAAPFGQLAISLTPPKMSSHSISSRVSPFYKQAVSDLDP